MVKKKNDPKKPACTRHQHTYTCQAAKHLREEATEFSVPMAKFSLCPPPKLAFTCHNHTCSTGFRARWSLHSTPYALRLHKLARWPRGQQYHCSVSVAGPYILPEHEKPKLGSQSPSKADREGPGHPWNAQAGAGLKPLCFQQSWDRAGTET